MTMDDTALEDAAFALADALGAHFIQLAPSHEAHLDAVSVAVITAPFLCDAGIVDQHVQRPVGLDGLHRSIHGCVVRDVELDCPRNQLFGGQVSAFMVSAAE
jgi:hypothetical protein